MTTLATTAATIETLTNTINQTISAATHQITHLDEQVAESGYRSLLHYERDQYARAAAILEVFEEAHMYLTEPRDQDQAIAAAYQVAVRTLARTQSERGNELTRHAAVELLTIFH